MQNKATQNYVYTINVRFDTLHCIHVKYIRPQHQSNEILTLTLYLYMDLNRFHEGKSHTNIYEITSVCLLKISFGSMP